MRFWVRGTTDSFLIDDSLIFGPENKDAWTSWQEQFRREQENDGYLYSRSFFLGRAKVTKLYGSYHGKLYKIPGGRKVTVKVKANPQKFYAFDF